MGEECQERDIEQPVFEGASLQSTKGQYVARTNLSSPKALKPMVDLTQGWWGKLGEFTAKY